MRSYEVLKTFKYSPDGIKIVDLRKGDTDGINDNDIGSMIKAGYINVLISTNKESTKDLQDELQSKKNGDPNSFSPNNKMLLAMDKNDIEKILRQYGFEFDRRKSFKNARVELIECVLLNQLEDGTPKNMIKFYKENFDVNLNLDDKNSESLAVEMASILELAFNE